MTNWIKLLEEKEDEIKERLEQLYEKACNPNTTDHRLTFALVMDEEGYINEETSTGNTIDGKVWEGKAIYVGAITEFNPLNFEEEEKEFIFDSLRDEEKESYLKWRTEDTIPISVYDVIDWNEETGNRLLNNYIDDVVSCNAPEFAEEEFNRIYDEQIIKRQEKEISKQG